MLNESMNVVAARGFERVGEIVMLKEILEGEGIDGAQIRLAAQVAQAEIDDLYARFLGRRSRLLDSCQRVLRELDRHIMTKGACAVAGVVALACLGGAVTIATFGARSYHREHRQMSAGMNQPVRDGSFQFTADTMRCGVQAIGSPDEEQSPIAGRRFTRA